MWDVSIVIWIEVHNQGRHTDHEEPDLKGLAPKMNEDWEPRRAFRNPEMGSQYIIFTGSL